MEAPPPRPGSAGYEVGRFVADNLKAFAVGAAILAGLTWLAWEAGERREALAQKDAATALQKSNEAAAAVAARTAEERRRRCTDDVTSAVIQPAEGALKLGQPNRALDILNACGPLLADPRALALRQRAQIAQKAIDDKARAAVLAEKKKHGVSIGMNMQDVVQSSWGKPRKINRTTTARGKREQWVYDSGYLYFEDGILTAVQN